MLRLGGRLRRLPDLRPPRPLGLRLLVAHVDLLWLLRLVLHWILLPRLLNRLLSPGWWRQRLHSVCRRLLPGSSFSVLPLAPLFLL